MVLPIVAQAGHHTLWLAECLPGTSAASRLIVGFSLSACFVRNGWWRNQAHAWWSEMQSRRWLLANAILTTAATVRLRRYQRQSTAPLPTSVCIVTDRVFDPAQPGVSVIGATGLAGRLPTESFDRQICPQPQAAAVQCIGILLLLLPTLLLTGLFCGFN